MGWAQCLVVHAALAPTAELTERAARYTPRPPRTHLPGQGGRATRVCCPRGVDTYAPVRVGQASSGGLTFAHVCSRVRAPLVLSSRLSIGCGSAQRSQHQQSDSRPAKLCVYIS